MPENTGTVQVILKDETIWCTQKAMAQLFNVGVPAISKHLNNIFEEGELDKDTTLSKMETSIHIYRAVLDIYATSIDYDPKAEISVEFFKKVQNKMHFAVHGQTAAEVILQQPTTDMFRRLT